MWALPPGGYPGAPPRPRFRTPRAARSRFSSTFGQRSENRPVTIRKQLGSGSESELSIPHSEHHFCRRDLPSAGPWWISPLKQLVPGVKFSTSDREYPDQGGDLEVPDGSTFRPDRVQFPTGNSWAGVLSTMTDWGCPGGPRRVILAVPASLLLESDLLLVLPGGERVLPERDPGMDPEQGYSRSFWPGCVKPLLSRGVAGPKMAGIIVTDSEGFGKG